MQKKKQEQDTSPLFEGITIEFLDATINLLFSENSAIDRFSLIEIQSFFNKLNLKDFERSYDKFMRSVIIKKAVKIRLDMPCISPEMLAERLIENSPKYSEDIQDYLSQGTDEVSTDDIRVIVSVYKKRNRKADTILLSEKFIRMYDKFRNDDIDDEEEFCMEVMLPLLSKMQNSFTARDSNEGCLSFNMSHDSLMDISTRFIKEKQNPSFKVKTGYKAINAMTNGGYEPRRVYLYLGAPGRFKSGNQLNQIISAFKHNKKIQTKDKTKKPCFIYFTYENSAEETFERVFDHALGENAIDKDLSDGAKWTPEDLVTSLKKEGFSDDNAQMFFLYRRPMSQSVADIRRDIEICEGTQYECKGIFVDYVDKVKTTEKMNYGENEYARLGIITAELTALAKEKIIFIVTSGQLNRQAIQKLEEFSSRGRTDIGKDLFSSEVSDSKKLLDNCDAVFIQNLEKIVNDIDKRLYSFLTLKRIKMRGKDTMLNPYAVLGFVKDNGIALEEDIYDKNPDFKHSIEEFFSKNALIRPQISDMDGAGIRDKKQQQSLKAKKANESLRSAIKLTKNEKSSINPENIIDSDSSFDEEINF